jgi:hypothetical protein
VYRTTRSSYLAETVGHDDLGAQPLEKRLGETKLMFGELLNAADGEKGSERVKFGFGIEGLVRS